ncbi:MAG: DUF4199 domain-containing protein [Bacteroidetes bacterium]|nr:DUF4199 domain-containing protein [Bacteroidota bacterium]
MENGNLTDEPVILNSTKNTLLQVSIKFGLIGVLLSIILFMALYFVDRNPLINSKFFDFIVIPIMIFFAIKEYRDYENQGKLWFWQGMSIGFINYMTIGIFSALFVGTFIVWIDGQVLMGFINNRVDYLMTHKVEILKEMNEDRFIETIENVKKISTMDVLWDQILRKMIIGLFLTIILSVFLRK